jgi:DNA-directed RNA polymerase subunit K/omega
MSLATYSRGPNLDLEKCVENMENNRYMLIVVASAKAREIAAKNKHSTRFEHLHPVITSLKEVEDGTLDITGIKSI